MTPDGLSRVRTAIDDDARFTNDLEWPMPAKRINLYLALARAVWEWVEADVLTGAATWPEGHDFYDTETRAIHAALSALSALAPDADAGEAGT